jgi:ABC-2 type transport system permease protein
MTFATRLMVRDELIGFAKSKVMLVLWLVLPALCLVGYLVLPAELFDHGAGVRGLSATAFMAFITSSIAGTVAALMVAVDIVAEKNRKVYELYVIRPVRPEAIIWAKFLAVFLCVTVGCVTAILLGIGLDWIRGEPIEAKLVYDAFKSNVAMVGVIAISAAVGVFFGVICKTIVVAVLLVLYGGQNIAIIPMLPMYLGIFPNQFWIVMLISAGVTLGLQLVSGVVFRRAQY